MEYLRSHGASFFQAVQHAAGGGYPGESMRHVRIWVGRGMITNDGCQSVACIYGAARRRRKSRDVVITHSPSPVARTRSDWRKVRWALHPAVLMESARLRSEPRRSATVIASLWCRLPRDHAENLVGGFSAVDDVLQVWRRVGVYDVDLCCRSLVTQFAPLPR